MAAPSSANAACGATRVAALTAAAVPETLGADTGEPFVHGGSWKPISGAIGTSTKFILRVGNHARNILPGIAPNILFPLIFWLAMGATAFLVSSSV